MRKAILVLAVLVASVSTAEASTTAIHVTPASGVAGQRVTFTATFTSYCSGALTKHYFTIDRKVYTGTLVQKGLTGSETLSISTLTVGSHGVSYNWWIGTSCNGVASMTYTVAAPPSPTPSPSPSPSPSPTPLATPVALVANRPSDTPLIGYLGIALILVTVVAGVVLAVTGRR